MGIHVKQIEILNEYNLKRRHRQASTIQLKAN